NFGHDQMSRIARDFVRAQICAHQFSVCNILPPPRSGGFQTADICSCRRLGVRRNKKGRFGSRPSLITLRTHEFPINSNNSSIGKTLERFRESKISRPLVLAESDKSEICSVLALQNG